MISRRLLMRAAGIAALAGIAKPAHARAESALEGLQQMPADRSPVHIENQGWFVSTETDGEADGIVRVAGPDGTQWLRQDFNGALKPEWFAEPQDGSNDAAMIQRACDHAERFGPFAVALGSRSYRCETLISIDPTRVALQGIDALLDFSSRDVPPSSPPIVTIADFTQKGIWQNRDDLLVADETFQPLRHAMSLPDDGRYRITFSVAELTGVTSYPALTVAVIGERARVLAEITVIAPGDYVFEVEGPQPTAQLTLTTTAQVQLQEITVTPEGRRECILVRATKDSPQYGHKWIDGIDILGPGREVALHGIRFETLETAKSSRLSMRQVSVRGFQTGLVFSHRAYLIHGVRLRLACDVALHFIGASEDAGELITLSDSVIDGGSIALRNDGGEFILTGCAIDFVDQVLVGSGRLTLQGCHLEVNRPKASDAPLFDLPQGTLAILGGSFGVTGFDFDAGNQCDHIFELRSRAAFATMNDVTVYNLRSQSHALAGGEGRLEVARVRGRRPRHMAPIVQFKSSQNLLGALPFDLRAGDTPAGPFERFPTQASSFKVTPLFRHLRLFGSAPMGVEIGVAFDVRSNGTGNVKVVLLALGRDTQIPIGDEWVFAVGTDWRRFAEHTGDTHPSALLDGRVPAGYDAIALEIDLSELSEAVEIASPFLSAT